MTTDAEDSPADAPIILDLRHRLRVAGDQGRRGTCVAFAVTAIHEADRGIDGADGPEDLAEEVLFWGAKQIDGDHGDGTRFSSADAALGRWGQPPEELWPYDDARDQRAASYVPPPGAIEPGSCNRAALRPITADLDAVRAELGAGRPVVVGIPVWDGLRLADTEPLPAPEPAELYPTRHAVVLVGYDPTGDALLLRNSWGLRWGSDGHLWVNAALLTLATGAWVIDTATMSASLAVGVDEEVLT